MAEWSPPEYEWSSQYDPYQYAPYAPYYQGKEATPVPPPQAQPYVAPPPQAQPYVAPPSPTLTLLSLSPQMQYPSYTVIPRGDNPREIRNKAEKQRRDKLNQSIADLASIVPPVVAASRKMHKTGVLRLTAHYLRAHQYVFGDSIGQKAQEFTPSSAQALLNLFNGFLLTTTYKGIVVVVSQNVNKYLGYSELDLLGQSIFNITHEDDRQMLKEQLMPQSQLLGPNGELLVPDEPDGKRTVEEALAKERRRFIVRFKKLGQRAQPSQYVTCHVEGSLRKSDRACRGYNRCCQMVRRARARGDNPCSSGNDVVFIGVVRPTAETFINESGLESFRMEYRTRHSIDGEIIQCEQRIALVTGYMMHEVNGVNAMNFMHRDDVRFVIIALREMYDQHRLFGESCYRLMTKNGQFVYMRTRGRLDVDQDSRAVTSFVCTNTVVGADEGKHLIKLMKKKFTLIVNNNDNLPDEDDVDDMNDNERPVEDPRQLEKVIMHLVTNLPSPEPEDNPRSVSPDRGESPSIRLSIIPPKKERIVSAIERIYNVFKTFQKDPEQTANVVEIKTTERNSNKSESASVVNNNFTPSSHMIQTPIESSIQTESFTHIPEAPTLAPYIDKFVDPIKVQTDGQSNEGSTFDSQAQYSTSNNMPETYPQITSLALANIRANDKDTIDSKTGTIKYHLYIAPCLTVERVNQEESNIIQQLSQPGTSNNASGIKRPNYSEEIDVAFKKKLVDVVKENERTGHDSPTLENFFDEAMLNTQIESAINSLDQVIDPTFPDLLISTDVQDILGEIDDEDQRPG